MNTLPTTPRELLMLSPSTQTQIDIFSDGIIQAVEGGEVNALSVLIQLRSLEKASERILKTIKDNLMVEADKFPGARFEFFGNVIEKAELGTKYDFSNCNDPVYNALVKVTAESNKQLKDREAFLKAVKEPFTYLDEGSGELATIYPPTKTSQSGLKVTIK